MAAGLRPCRLMEGRSMEKFTELVSQSSFHEWQDAHNTGIGASQIAAVLGESRYGSRLRVWAEKIGRLEPADLSDNEAVQMGIILEPIVADIYKNRTGRVISQAGTLLRSVQHPWAICTPDYWLCGDDGAWNIPLQIKTTSAYRISDWAEGPPKGVWWQVQHEMLVTGAPWASVGVLVGGQRFMWADVQRDDAAQARIVEEGSEFWQDVVNRTYPQLDGDANSGEAIAALFPTSAEGEQVALPQEAVAWAGDLRRMKSERSYLDDEVKILESKLKLAIGEAEGGVLHDGSGIFTHKGQSRWSYKPLDGMPRAEQSGDHVVTIATKTDFRVLRFSEIKGSA